MFYEDRQIIKKGNHIQIRRVASILQDSQGGGDRLYETEVLEVIGPEFIKIAMPKGYGDTVTLSLDTIYEITVNADSYDYHGRGRVEERFRDESGNVCLVRLTESLAREDNKNLMHADMNADAEYITSGMQESDTAVITRIGIDRIRMETFQYIPDDEEIQVCFSADGLKDIKAGGRVQETIRLRSGKYESSIIVKEMSLKQQRELASWMLRRKE